MLVTRKKLRSEGGLPLGRFCISCENKGVSGAVTHKWTGETRNFKAAQSKGVSGERQRAGAVTLNGTAEAQVIEIERFSIFGAVTNIDLILMGCGGVWGLGGDQLAQSAVGRPDAFAEGSEHGFPWGGKIELRGWKEGGRDWAVIAAVFTPNIIPKWLPKAREKRTERKRPCALEPHCWANVLPPDQYSFPSGHSTTAFAIVVPLSLYYPHLTDVLVFLAMSIAVSRILLEMHFLSDVIAGGLPGAGLGYSSYRIFCVFS